MRAKVWRERLFGLPDWNSDTRIDELRSDDIFNLPHNTDAKVDRSTENSERASNVVSNSTLHALNEKKFDMANLNVNMEKAADDLFDLPLNVNAKVDNWLNSTQHPTGPAASRPNPLGGPPIILYDSSNKMDETSSTVSNKSAIRAKLLDKTARVKQTLRNLTQNN